MNYEYICAGNLIMDSHGMMNAYLGCEENAGGPATFAYSGVRLWTDSVMQVSRTGADYDSYFKGWIQHNNVETKGIKVVCDRSNHLYGFMHGYAHDPANMNAEFSRGHATTVDPAMRRYVLDAWQDFGYQKVRPEDIGEFTKDGGVKGVYLAANPDTVFWKQLGDIKARDGFKIMWEIEGIWAQKEFMDMVMFAAQYADIFSINVEETRNLFGCESDEDCIKGLQHSSTDPNDVSKEPHGITHGPDALRYFAQTYVLPGEKEEEEEPEDDFDDRIDYQSMMCGGHVTKGYIYA